uniref:Uncharacterized protein n=1 Tax=Ditylenchus dipsaci TaxID=166011 RepID=A0A915DY31_9BILA
MRKDEHGNEIKESNAKIVKWSDGTMSLYLGNEIFDVEKDKIPDHNHLYIRQGPGLQAQAVFKEKLVFRPFSTDTLTHRKMTMNMADKSNKAQKVKVIADVGSNPEKEKQESIRREEERLRANARRESHQRRVRDRPRVTGLSSNFLEGVMIQMMMSRWLPSRRIIREPLIPVVPALGPIIAVAMPLIRMKKHKLGRRPRESGMPKLTVMSPSLKEKVGVLRKVRHLLPRGRS